MDKIKLCIISAIQLLVGVRKMIVALIFMGVGLILLALNQFTGAEYLNASRDVVVAFMATNMVEHLAQRIGSWGKK